MPLLRCGDLKADILSSSYGSSLLLRSPSKADIQNP
tara:strand:- start:1195 stop:1302 length:108 start_codon:yes stop_codon:yes gene_type:complete